MQAIVCDVTLPPLAVRRTASAPLQDGNRAQRCATRFCIACRSGCVQHAEEYDVSPPPHAGDVGAYITDICGIRGTRGGRLIEDQFDMISTDMVASFVGEYNRTQGHGALVFRENRTAVMLVPPLEFRFKAKRDGDGDAAELVTKLVITGHFMCLVDNGPSRSPRWAFDDDRAEYAKENKLAYKIVVAAAMHDVGPGVIPSHLLQFLSLLMEL